VFSRLLPNNAWGMEHHWEGGFPLVWFDGEDGRNVDSRHALEPLCYFLYKNRKEQKTGPLHNRLFVKLPTGKTPDDMIVESIDGLGGIYVGGNHVTVRNFVCEYGGRDGFATHRNKDVVIENIEARYLMDQGMSHHGAQVLVRNAHFHHNAGCGVVDVYLECKARYENCLIEADTWRGGVEFYSGAFEMVDCVIRANQKRALTVTRGAQVKLHNCLLIAPVGQASSLPSAPDSQARSLRHENQPITTGIDVGGEDSRLEMNRCTLYGFTVGLNARMTAANRVTVNGCAWLRCKTNCRVRSVQAHGEPAVNLSECLHFAGNLYEPASWELNTLRQVEDGSWKTDQHSFAANEHAQFASQIGSDADAVTTTVDAADPTILPPLHTAAGRPVGARIPQPLVVGPRPLGFRSEASSNRAIER